MQKLKMIDLNELAQDALKTAKKRETKGQLMSDTFSILKHCAGEVCESVDAYSRLAGSDNEIYDAILKSQYADELADVITCALIAAAREDMDIEAALFRVKEKNARRAE